MSSTFDCEVLVVGLGAMGSCTLWSLARRGVAAIGIDQYDTPHDQGSSHGETRLIRSAMIEGPAYVPLIRRAFELWRELEAESARQLFTQAGVLLISRDGARDLAALAAGALQNAGLPYETLGSTDLARRYPQHRGTAELVATLDPSGGFVRAEDTLTAALHRAQELGASIMRRTTALDFESMPGGGLAVDTDTGKIRAQHVVISVGAWLPTFLDDRQVPVELERQVFAYFELDGSVQYGPEAFPPFMREESLIASPDAGAHAWLSHGLSGFPSLDGKRLKLVLLKAGHTTTMASLDRTVSDSSLEELKLSDVDPRLVGIGRPSAGSGKACLYSNAPDRNFLIGRLPEGNVTVVSACSGHGFKFAPAIGEIAADLATGTQPRVPIEPFSPSRVPHAFQTRART